MEVVDAQRDLVEHKALNYDHILQQTSHLGLPQSPYMHLEEFKSGLNLDRHISLDRRVMYAKPML